MVMFHGLFGSSWLSEEWVRALEKADLRCIALERPGYGDSSAVEMKRAAEWAELFTPVVEELAIHDAAAVGCSAGSVYAYVPIGVHRRFRHLPTSPMRVDRIYIIGSWISTFGCS